MKKLLALLLCLMLVCSAFVLTSCDEPDLPKDSEDDDSNTLATLNDKTPEELYEETLERISSITNYEMTTSQVITMNVNGKDMTVNQSISAKMDGQEQYVKATNDTASEANMEIWYVDEWLYTINRGSQVKANISYEKMQTEYAPEGSDSSSALMNIPEHWFKDVLFQKEGDLYYIEFIVSGSEYLQYMQSTALGDLVKDATDISYKVYFDADGNLENIVTECDYTVSQSGTTVEAHLVATTTISNIGNVTITPPTGSFIDVTDRM